MGKLAYIKLLQIDGLDSVITTVIFQSTHRSSRPSNLGIMSVIPPTGTPVGLEIPAKDVARGTSSQFYILIIYPTELAKKAAS